MPTSTMAFLAFLRDLFPGDCNPAARNKLRTGGMSQVLVAMKGIKAVRNCKWESDGPVCLFGVGTAMRSRGLGRVFLNTFRWYREAGMRHIWFNRADVDALDWRSSAVSRASKGSAG